MSATTTASNAASTCGGVNSQVLPVQDAACGLPNTGNYSAVMDKCCGPAKVSKFNDECGLFCLAQEQSTKDLLECIQENGGSKINIGGVFCSGNMTATATAAVPSSTGKDSDGTGTATGTGADATATGDENMGVAMKQPLSKGGLSVLAVLGLSALLSAF